MDKVVLEWKQKRQKELLVTEPRVPRLHSCICSVMSRTFEIALHAHFKWEHAGDGHAAKGARGDRPAPAVAAADIPKAQLKRKPEKCSAYEGHKSSDRLQCGVIYYQSGCYHGHYGCKHPG